MKDLSDLAKGTLNGDASMHAGNTVSVPPKFAPVGSESEATQGIATHSRPEPDLGPNNDGQLKTATNGGGSTYTLTPRTWKTVK